MLSRLDPIREVATQLRSEFERGLVTDEEILEAAIAYNDVSSISTLGPPRELTEEEAAQYYIVGRIKSRVPKPITNASRFPGGHCDAATLVLRSRIETADLMENNLAEIIHGGCGEDGLALDLTRYWHNYHTFLGIGHTALGRDTIVDITGNQFIEVREAVYLGPLVTPWTRDPRIEMWEI